MRVRHLAFSLEYRDHDDARLENHDHRERVAIEVDAAFEPPTTDRLKSCSSACSERFSNVGSLDIAIVTMLSGVNGNEKLIGRSGTMSSFQSLRIGHFIEDSLT
jgi:hypothetical protein